jgi:hypothetical protein
VILRHLLPLHSLVGDALCLVKRCFELLHQLFDLGQAVQRVVKRRQIAKRPGIGMRGVELDRQPVIALGIDEVPLPLRGVAQSARHLLDGLYRRRPCGRAL